MHIYIANELQGLVGSVSAVSVRGSVSAVNLSTSIFTECSCIHIYRYIYACVHSHTRIHTHTHTHTHTRTHIHRHTRTYAHTHQITGFRRQTFGAVPSTTSPSCVFEFCFVVSCVFICVHKRHRFLRKRAQYPCKRDGRLRHPACLNMDSVCYVVSNSINSLFYF